MNTPARNRCRANPSTCESDIYALGVILYELLAGQRPYRIPARSWDAARQVICEEEPIRPSEAVRRTRLDVVDRCNSSIEPGPPREDPRQLRRRLQGDLDNLVMCALRKDVSRRYGSVEQLADDIEAYLADEPLRHARPESRMYVLRKTAHRHRFAIGAAAAVAIALITGLSAATAMYVRAERRAAQLARVTEFQQSMLSDISVESMGISILNQQRMQLQDALDADETERLEQFDTLRSAFNPTDLARSVMHAHLLRGVVETIESEFEDDPVVEAALRQTAGDAYVDIGMYDEGMKHIQRAIVLRRTHLGPGHRETLASMQSKASLLEAMGRYDESATLHRSVWEGRQQALGRNHSLTLGSLSDFGHVLMFLGEYEEAESNLRAAHEGLEDALGPGRSVHDRFQERNR